MTRKEINRRTTPVRGEHYKVGPNGLMVSFSNGRTLLVGGYRENLYGKRICPVEGCIRFDGEDKKGTSD